VIHMRRRRGHLILLHFLERLGLGFGEPGRILGHGEGELAVGAVSVRPHRDPADGVLPRRPLGDDRHQEYPALLRCGGQRIDPDRPLRPLHHDLGEIQPDRLGEGESQRVGHHLHALPVRGEGAEEVLVGQGDGGNQQEEESGEGHPPPPAIDRATARHQCWWCEGSCGCAPSSPSSCIRRIIAMCSCTAGSCHASW